METAPNRTGFEERPSVECRWPGNAVTERGTVADRVGG